MAQLQAEASKLLKGCQYHFRSGISRVSKASAVVHPQKQKSFVKRVAALLQVDTPSALDDQVGSLLKEFPDTRRFFQ